MGHQAPAAPILILRGLIEPVFESPFYRRVDRVQPAQRQRLGRRKPASGRGRRPVVAENAVQQRQPARFIESPHAVLGQQLLTEHQMTER